jgi:sortase A
MRIPKIDLNQVVVEGVGVPELKKGPGHYPSTPLPGRPGNAGVAGHRTTYGAPFGRLDELAAGDSIEVETLEGAFTYRVTEVTVVSPDQRSVLYPTSDSRLTLTTCHPKYSASRRLIVVAALVAPPVTTSTTAPLPRFVRPTRPGPPPDLAGLSGDHSSPWATLVLGLLTVAVVVLTQQQVERRRRWTPYLWAAPLLLPLLYLFCESFAHVLPANA